MSRVSMAGDDGHASLIGALCELTSRIWIEGRRVQGHGMPSVEMRSARGAARLEAGRKKVRGKKESGSSSSSAWEENAVER